MSRTARHATTSVGLVALTALLLLGCTSDPTDPSSTPSTSSPTTSEPSPTETPLTPEEEAIAAAEDAIPAYFAASDKALATPDTFNAADFEKVAIGSALVDLQNLLASVQAQGFHQIGETQVVSIDSPTVDLTEDLDATPPVVPIVEADVCYDVSELNIVDAEGKSTTPADRAPRGLAHVGVTNYEYPDGPWLVAFVDYKDGESC